MTNYDAMEAGREMDTLIAEKVMGNTPGKVIIFHDDGTSEETLGWASLNDADLIILDKRPPRHSTNFVEALRVVEKMDDPSCAHSLRIDKFDNFFYVTFGVGGTRTSPKRAPRDYDGMAEDLPLAICRAALKAVGAE